ncbi:MAG: NUDIX domain-containing protein [Candidatus Moraniibacteriota bacterium]
MFYKLILISIIHRKNKSEILLVKRNREPGLGKWSLPGGTGALRDEPNPELAIGKEIFGDFAVNAIDPKLFRLKYTAEPDPTLHLYFQTELEEEPKIKSVKTIQALRWFPLEEISQIDLAFKKIDTGVVEQFQKELS